MVERFQPSKANGSARAGRNMGAVAVVPPRVKSNSAMGVSGVSVLGGLVRSTERNADWIGSRKWQTIADLSVNVSIVAASVQYFLNMVAHPQWHVSPAEDKGDGKSSKEATDLAEFVEDVIHDMTTPWQRVVRRSCMYRFNGFGIQEWIAKKRDDGKIGIRDIEPRPAFTIERWSVDDDGTVLGVWQRSPQTFELLGLPRGKLIYMVDDTYTDQPDGIGVYRMLGEPFNRLKQYLELEARAYERDMRGIPVGRAPITVIKQMVAENRLTKEEGEQMLQGLRDFITMQVRDKNTSLLMDSMPYENQTADGLSVASSMQWDVSLLSGGVTGLAEMAAAIDRLQREMARIIGTEHLMMGDAGGSRALSQDKSRNLYLIANSVLANIADAMDHDLIDPLWSLNGFDPKLKPYFATEDVAFKDAQEIATALAAMATAGAVLSPDDPAIDDVRDLLGISKAPEPTPEQLGMLQGVPGAPEALGAQLGIKPPPTPAPGMPGGPVVAGGKQPKTPKRTSPPETGDAKQRQVAANENDTKKKPIKKWNPFHDIIGRFTSGDGAGTKVMETAGDQQRFVNALMGDTSNKAIALDDPKAGQKTSKWLKSRYVAAKYAREIKDVAANLGPDMFSRFSRDAVVISAVETALETMTQGHLGFAAYVAAASAIGIPIGMLANKLGLTDANIKSGLVKGTRWLIEARKTQVKLGRLSRLPAGAVGDITSGRVLTKEVEAEVEAIVKADYSYDAVLTYLNALLDALNAYQPKGEPRDKASLNAADAIVHQNRLNEVTGMEKFNPNHDDVGRFASGDGGGSLEGYSSDAKLIGGKIHTSNVDDAAKALAEDREVELEQPQEVATLLDKLAAMGKESVAAGAKAKVYDLCKVSVAGTNLFCAESLGIPRIDMPQLSGKPLTGSKADGLPKNSKGEVNLGDEFTKHLSAIGGEISDETVDASYLRASQNELNGSKVAGIYSAMANGTLPAGDRLFVSKDGYIIDGHHRWAAGVTYEYAGAGHTVPMEIRRVNIDTVSLLNEAKKFAKDWGLPQMAKRRGGWRINAAGMLEKFNPNHDQLGLFATGDGGGYQISHRGTLEGYAPAPANNASELFARTYDPTVTVEQVMAMAGSYVAAKAADADAKIAAGTPSKPGHQTDGKYNPDVVAVHSDILNNGGKGDWKGFTPEAIDKATPAEGEQPTLYVLGGRGGAGKSWFTKSPDSPFDASKTMIINSDDFKESLPDYQGWNAALVHEEASDIADLAHDRARSTGLNVTLDATLSSSRPVANIVAQYEKAGYRIEGYFMHTAPQVSAVRAMGRFDRTGRYVPAAFIMNSKSNEASFDRLSSHFAKWSVYDNNTDRGPVMVASKKD